MNRTKIEWCDYSWNPITGCLNNCEYCYARKIAKRFYGHFIPTFHLDRLWQPYKTKKPSKIFVCSMGEMFGDWIPDGWIELILEIIKKNPQHIFQILTKYPKRMSKFTFPDNCWTGVTIDSHGAEKWNLAWIKQVNSNIKFVSFEPLLTEVNGNLFGIDWIIIGAQTNPLKIPKKEWVKKLIEQARTLGIAVFIKDNIHWHKTIREFPT